METTTPEEGTPPGPATPPPSVPAAVESYPEAPDGSAPALDAAPPPPAAEGAPAPAEPDLPAAPAAATGSPPPEVERDIIAELSLMDHANAVGRAPEAFVATAPTDPLAFDTRSGLTAEFGGSAEFPTATAAPAPAPRTSMRVARTLVDLCANFPRLQSGEFWLRVERKSPATHRGSPCAGWIENFNGPLTAEDFRDRYGGGVYEVRVQGPQESTVGRDGVHPDRTHATLDNFRIAGAPVFGKPEDQDDMDRSGRRFPLGVPQNHAVDLKRIELAAVREGREQSRNEHLTDQLLASRTPDPGMFAQTARLADRHAQDIRDAAAEAQGALRASNKRLADQLERCTGDLIALRDDKDATINRLREEAFEIRQEAEKRGNQQETTRIREVKDQNERELRRVREDHVEKLETITRENQRVMVENTSRWDRERSMMTESFQSERRDLKEAAETARREGSERLDRREAQLQQDHRSKVDADRASFESRLAEGERAAAREHRSFKENFESRLQSIQALESGKSASAEQGAAMHVNMMQSEVARSNGQIDELQRENSALRDRLLEITSKDPMQAFAEAKHMIDSIGGGGADEPTNWQAAATSIIKNLTDRAPDIVKEIQVVRQQNQQNQNRQLPAPQPGQQPPPQRQRAHRAPPPGMQQQQPMRQQHAPPMTAAHAGPQRAAAPLGSGVAPRPTSAPLWSGQSVPDPPAAPEPVEVPQAPVEHVSMTNPHPPPAVVAIPAQDVPAPAGPEQAPAPPPPTPAPAAPPHAALPAPPPAPPEEQLAQEPPPPAPAAEQPRPAIDIPPEAFGYFSEQLDEAIKGGIIDEEIFAGKIIEALGPDVTRQLLIQITPDQYIAAIRESTASSYICSRKGERYVHNLWSVVGKLLG